MPTRNRSNRATRSAVTILVVLTFAGVTGCGRVGDAIRVAAPELPTTTTPTPRTEPGLPRTEPGLPRTEPGLPRSEPVPEPAPPPTSELSDDELARTALAEAEAFWSLSYPDLTGRPYVPLDGAYGYGPATAVPPCPGIETYRQIAGNAFYCPAANLVAWDRATLIPSLRNRFGDVTIGIVMAHEVGHGIQHRAGFGGRTVTMEQQADCFAGAWTAHATGDATSSFRIGLDDLDRAIAGFLRLRDAVGTNGTDPGAHGTAFDRIGAFQDGFEHGIVACGAYDDRSVAARLVEVPFTSAADLATGGHLPFADAVELSVADLESFWSTTFAAAGAHWTPLRDLALPDEADQVYETAGDYGVSLLLGLAYSRAVQERLDAGSEGTEGALQRDCLAGAWAASSFHGDRPDAALSLSPGDLDEAVVTLIVLGSAADDGTERAGSAFERVGAFRSGFLAGIAGCA